jgi:dihydrofolate reductase
MRAKLDLSIVVAMTPDRVIGKDGDLPWGRIPSDLRRFRSITMEAGTVILGRATYDSITKRLHGPLPSRRHIVLSKTGRVSRHENVTFVTCVTEALVHARHDGPQACVIGGAQIYELFLPHVTSLCVTTVYADLPGDTYFPAIGPEWAHCGAKGLICRWEGEDAHETAFDRYLRKE